METEERNGAPEEVSDQCLKYSNPGGNREVKFFTLVMDDVRRYPYPPDVGDLENGIMLIDSVEKAIETTGDEEVEQPLGNTDAEVGNRTFVFEN